jgi:RNAse (barnase) inhibitor barstar
MKPMAKQLADTQQCGVYQLVSALEAVERAAQEAGLAVFRIDIGEVRNKADFLGRVAKALSFPNWFGSNWDALNDCLTDLDWLSTKTGYVLIFENSDDFGSHHKSEFDTATDVLNNAAEYWKEEGRSFWAFMAVAGDWESGLTKWPSGSGEI